MENKKIYENLEVQSDKVFRHMRTCGYKTRERYKKAMKRGMRVKIIVHYSKSEKELSELSKKVADLHIEAIISYLNNQSCPKEQKIYIIII